MKPSDEALELAVKRECAGLRKTWPWKGWPCAAVPKFQKDGKWYCKNHLPIDAAMPKDEGR